MSKDYVPVRDQDLDSWLVNFVTVLANNAAQLGLVPADITPIDQTSTAFQSALLNYLQKKPEMDSASTQKKNTRTAAVDVLRPLVRRINNHPGMTDELRSLLGLPVKSTGGRTVLTAGPEVPGIFLETTPGSVTVHFGTEPQNERINGKPAWARGCNIYRKRAGEQEYALVAYQNASPWVDTINGPGADYTYVVRYRGVKASDLGGESLEATVAARGAMAA